MFAIFYERRHRVLMVRITGVLSSEDIDTHDRVVLRFLAGKEDVRAIYDLSGVETLASYMIFQALSMTCIGLCGSNFGAMAMEPVGHIAGLTAPSNDPITMTWNGTYDLQVANSNQRYMIELVSTGNRLIVIGDSILAGTAARYGNEMCNTLVPMGWNTVVEAEAGRIEVSGRQRVPDQRDVARRAQRRPRVKQKVQH